MLSIDYHELYKLTISNSYPLLLSDDILGQMFWLKYSAKVNSWSENLQVGIALNWILQTLFHTSYGYLELY